MLKLVTQGVQKKVLKSKDYYSTNHLLFDKNSSIIQNNASTFLAIGFETKASLVLETSLNKRISPVFTGFVYIYIYMPIARS